MAAASTKNSEIALSDEDDFLAAYYLPFDKKPGEEFTGTVAGGADWCDFYIRPDGVETELLEQVNLGLNAFFTQNPMPTLKELGLWKTGVPCATRFAKDNLWYRARLEDMDYNMVRFVDYGNAQLVSEADVKPLPRIFADICVPTCIRCTLTRAQDVILPSFVNDNSKVRVTIIGTEEPYEVTIQIVDSEANAALNTANAVAISADVHPTGRFGNRQWPPQSNLPGASSGLSLAQRPARTGSPIENGVDDLKANSRSLPVARGPLPTGQTQFTKFNIINCTGIISDLHATCGYVRLQKYPARGAEVNTEQSAFFGGPLQVNDLRRLFRVKERVKFSAKREQPYISQAMEFSRMVVEDEDAEYKKKKAQQQPAETEDRWLVTDFRPHLEDRNILIAHAVVNFIGDTACSLYVRSIEQSVWAPKGTFPESVSRSTRSLRELVEIGRSVVVRAEPTDQLADFKVEAPWMAKAVEFVGGVQEERGSMYLVRDTYSVIITEGNVGFGYVYVPNNYVEPEGAPMEEWAGMRVYFRSCLDIPDGEDGGRFGWRMKGLRARLSPTETRIQPKCRGIYRPPPVDIDDNGARASTAEKAKKLDPSEEEFLELPAETVQEMRILGVDTIGIEKPSTFETPAAVEVVRENVLNEIRIQSMNEPEDETVAEGASTKPKQPETTTLENGSVAEAESAAAPPAPNLMDDDAELVSTVEISIGGMEPLVLTPLATPPLRHSIKTPSLANGHAEGLQVAADSAPAEATPPTLWTPAALASISTGCQTVAMVIGNEEQLVKEAVAEWRSAKQEDVYPLLDFSFKLDERRKARFMSLWNAVFGH